MEKEQVNVTVRDEEGDDKNDDVEEMEVVKSGRGDDLSELVESNLESDAEEIKDDFPGEFEMMDLINMPIAPPPAAPAMAGPPVEPPSLLRKVTEMFDAPSIQTLM